MVYFCNLLKTLRPKQWLKNGFLFAPLIFSFQFFNLELLIKTAIAFFSFSLLSGVVYIVNDLVDREKDCLHPEKRERPIASGKISSAGAIIFACVIFLFNMPICIRLGQEFLIIVSIYLLLNLGYSFFLKQVVILDVLVIAVGFVLRIMAGGAVDQIEVSNWILLTTFLLAIFLALIKRRQELVRFKEVPDNARRTLAHYSVHFIDQMIVITTALTIMTYILYTMSEEIRLKYGPIKLVFTVPFVLFGMFRYLYLVYIKGWGENPSDVLLRDLTLDLIILFWLLTFVGLVLAHLKI